MSQKAGVASRLGAYEALRKWQEGYGFVAENIPSLLKGQERAIAMDIAMGVCRNITLLEYNVRRRVKFMPSNEVRRVLLTGMWQLYQKDRYPTHVSVDLTVELAKSLGLKKEVSLINAVMRKVDREGLEVPRHSKKIKDVAICYSHPTWLIHKWNENMGFDKMIRRCRVNISEPRTFYRLNLSRCSKDEIEREFGEVEWRFERFFALDKPVGQMLAHSFFVEGKISIQDPASYLMVQLLGLEGKEILLDLCGAPGGKSALILEEFPEMPVVLGDLKWERLRRSRDLKERLGLKLTTVVADAQNVPYLSESFDRILIDAPCSNLGVLNRRPEAKWMVSEAELKKQSELQLGILNGAAALLKPGGVLVYGTCSPEPEETVQVVEAFLKEHPEFEVETARKWVHRHYTEGMFLKIWPQPNSLDGFFGARLVKRPL